MKKTASILLLALLSFNWIGYRFVTGLLEQQALREVTAQIDQQQYDESSLIELRIPLNAPYLSGLSNEFERYDGELEIDGIHYNYVKRKIDNGELVLMCLPNETQTRLQHSSSDYFKLVNDLGHATKGKEKNNAPSFKAIATDYYKENNSWSVAALALLPLAHTVASASACATGFTAIPEQPPRA